MWRDPWKGLVALASLGALFAWAARAGASAVGVIAAWIADVEAVIEARARKLPQGDYEVSVSVPGRVSGSRTGIA